MQSPFIDVKPSSKSKRHKNDKPKVVVNRPPEKKPLPPGKKQIPVTIFTGYLGAGKTTIIANLIKSVPESYKIAWLKNEIGQTAVDTELANASNTTLTKEMLQGCICHVMLGALSGALDELVASDPDRIIIETSGSATPAPVVWEIRDDPRLFMDGVVTVIDAINFSGYLDKSFTLKMQARFTDLILINKHEGMDERTLDQNLDDLYEINLDTPKIYTNRGHVSPDVLFGLDSTLFMTEGAVADGERTADVGHQMMEVDLLECTLNHVFDLEDLRQNLSSFPKKNFYRIKGVVNTNAGPHVINVAFGDVALVKIKEKEIVARLVCMGEELEDHIEKVSEVFHVEVEHIIYTPRKSHS